MYNCLDPNEIYAKDNMWLVMIGSIVMVMLTF